MHVRIDESGHEARATNVDLVTRNTCGGTEVVADRDDPSARDEHIPAPTGLRGVDLGGANQSQQSAPFYHNEPTASRPVVQPKFPVIPRYNHGLIGELIGNFRIVARIGEGGMGEVFIAEQQQIRTKVAIKMLLAKISENHEIVQRFFNEAIAVSKIQHSGIVKIFDVGFHAPTGRAYLVMEFLDGETLASRIKRGPMTIPEIADVGRQIASVFDAVNKAGITHRDLKPENIFLVPDAELPRGERIKILDFGIAKLTGAGVGMTSTSASSMGTPLYMSPEQWMSSAKVDWRADAYSLGCVLFEMITGRVPFTGESIGQLCAHHLHTAPARVGEIVPTAPALDALVTRLLAKAPEDRPGSMREIGAVFTSLEGAAPSAAYSMPMSAPSAPYSAAIPAATTGMPGSTTLGSAASSVSGVPPRKSRMLPILGGVVVAAGLGFGVFKVLEKPSQAPQPVAATAPTAPTAEPVPVAADAAVASVPVDAAQVAVVEDAGVEPPHIDTKPPVVATKKPTAKPPAKPVVKPPPPPDPNLPEKITRKMIKQMIATVQVQLDDCRTKGPQGGVVLLQADVNPDGSLGDVAFLKTPDVGVSKCVLAKLRDVVKFPPTKTGGTWKTQLTIAGARK
jgi:serine/threonine protein kinase